MLEPDHPAIVIEEDLELRGMTWGDVHTWVLHQPVLRERQIAKLEARKAELERDIASLRERSQPIKE